ncbi:MAG: nucleotide exchange factor GrpE [Treponema sp.]|nr:nucleotide exchange factor GrpE [Treponema sp.]
MSKHNHQSGASGKNNPASGEELTNQAEKEQPQSDKNPGQNPGGNFAGSAAGNPAGNPADGPADKQAADNNPDSAGQTGDKQAADKQAAEKEKTPAGKIADLEAKLAEVNDLYLRKAADFENFRKRMNKEKQDAIEYANQSLLLDMIGIMDDFERALKSAESIATGEFKAFYEGISMIEKRLSTQLENKWGLKRYNCASEPFDPNLHEAIQMEKTAAVDEPTVAEEYYKGYMLKDRVVRPAKVKVLMPDKNIPKETGGNDETSRQGNAG